MDDDDSSSPLPVGQLGRLVKLAGLGARMGATRARSLLIKANERRLAEAAAATLGQLRCLGLKLGQMASYVDGLVPSEHRDTYERALKSLRDAAPSMSEAAARRVVAKALGQPPEKVFAKWEAKPFASASMGQVHRAELRDGRKVAVKVQYEGIEQALRADLANVHLLGKLTGPLGQRFGQDRALQELKERFEEELDYEHEARQQERFANYFAGDARIRIPQVIPETSSRRVLTTQLVSGIGFDEACSRSESERRAWAETLWRFQFTSLVVHGHFHADPHPGNYVFGPDGGVWFLDFGCTRQIPQDRAQKLRTMHRQAFNNTEAFHRAFEAMVELPEGGKLNRVMRDYISACFAPIVASGEYRITHAYAAQLMDDLRKGSLAALTVSQHDFKPLPHELLFLNRLQFGFYSLLARMDVPVDYGNIHRNIVAMAPPSEASPLLSKSQ